MFFELLFISITTCADAEPATGEHQKKLGILKSDEVNNKKGSLARNDSQLEGNIGKIHEKRSYFAPHHIISISCAEDSLIMKAAAEGGYNINRGSNGIWLPNNPEIARIVNLPIHTGRHLRLYFQFA